LQVIASAEFLALGVLSLLVLTAAAWLDGRLHAAVSGRLRPDTRPDPRAVVPHVLRLSLATFFATATLYFQQPVYLTPELLATGAWVHPLQWTIAACLLWRRTAWLGALGIVALYAASVIDYGWFHLMDYPIFIAAALAVAIDSLRPGRHLDLALSCLRVGAGITLMWAGAEKWLYPWWSHEMLNHELAAVSSGMSSPFIMAAAGWVEFCAAYALVFGRLGAQVAAWVLLIPFVAAIPVFGAVDAIGHAPIIVVLLILGMTRTTLPPRWQGGTDTLLSPSTALHFALNGVLAAIALVGAYWLLQSAAYPRAEGLPQQDAAGAVLLLLPLLMRGLCLTSSAHRTCLREAPTATHPVSLEKPL
ncbi:hypothetical protein DBR42_25600, partial [Pelomonas sp. HMWF004]